MIVLDGSPASEGIGVGVIRRLSWRVPEVPRGVIAEGEAAGEIERFDEALVYARDRLVAVKEDLDGRLGSVEARIFDPQLLMLDDPQVVEGTREYIANHRMTAARAFDWRMLELKERWARTSHPMVLDRLNDLEDLKVRVLNRLLGIPDPWAFDAQEPFVVVAKDLTPSFAARVDPDLVAALATEEGTRTSHWAILARSLQIPAAVGLGGLMDQCANGQSAIVDGRTGRVVVDPDDEERQRYERRRSTIMGWADSIHVIAGQEAVTLDRQRVALRANLDLPGEAERARQYGAEGVGLLRTEFLVVGRNRMPGEEEQYEAYKRVAEAFPGHAVIIRTFDLGGDKFPMFLHMAAEENPFLGWRGVRVCLDQPELFMPQLRACLRATAHGDVRIMVPLVNTVGEIQAVRELLNTAADELRAEGPPLQPRGQAGDHDRDAGGGLEGHRTGPARGLLLHRDQRSRPVHPGGGPHQYPPCPPLRSLPPGRPEADFPGGAGGTVRGHRSQRVRRVGGSSPGRGAPPGPGYPRSLSGMALFAPKSRS